jgi:hypothetical protein
MYGGLRGVRHLSFLVEFHHLEGNLVDEVDLGFTSNDATKESGRRF